MITRLIMVIDGQKVAERLEKRLSHSDVSIECLNGQDSVWQHLVRSCADVIVMSFSLIPDPADSFISMIKELPENPTLVILHPSDSSEVHAPLVGLGADVILYERMSEKRLIEAIDSTLSSRQQMMRREILDRRDGQTAPSLSDFVYASQSMVAFMEEVRQMIPVDSPLLIDGETGVGKEHLAKAIHGESPRSNGPFVAVNTAALPDQLLESELFGHAQGAFTGAVRSRRGAFELAHGGTIFLDEIGEMPLHLQAKLLRVLQDYEVRPLGAETSVWVDVRVIAATNRDLEQAVAEKTFRRDLYYRLSVIRVTIPPLRERREDIPALAKRFLAQYRSNIKKNINEISPEAMTALTRYHWPGNVRELMNVIERAILLCKGGMIRLADLPGAFQPRTLVGFGDISSSSPADPEWEGKTLPAVLAEVTGAVELAYLTNVLTKTGGRVGDAARIAGIHPRSLYNKMRGLGLDKRDFRSAGN